MPPFISILIAARNEEKNILNCLQAISLVKYPKEFLEVLIGNDESEDNTATIVDNFIKNKPNFRQIKIKANEYLHTKGKARVISILANQAKGDYYFITDADMTISDEWINDLLPYFENKKVGIVSATTIMKPIGLNGGLQWLDWVYFMGILNAMSCIGIPSTSVGNNMAISKEAYWSTGGYDKIKFSITEDYKIYKEVRNKGYSTKNILSPKSLGVSMPVRGLIPFFHQRKRWLIGGKELPWYWWFMFGIFTLYNILILYFLFIDTSLALTIAFTKFLVQLTQQIIILKILDIRYLSINHSKNPFIFILYDIYLYLVTFITLIFFLIPTKTVWKGRNY